MGFHGFSKSNPKSYWIVGAIVLLIILTIILKKLATYLDSKGNKQLSKTKPDEENQVDEKSREMSIDSNATIRTYPLEELKMATKDFKIRIGVGATSYVYLAELEDGRLGAVKRVMEERGGKTKLFLDEVSVLLRISHPNLVGLMGFCLDKGEQLLLLEYVPNKSLFERMHTYHGQSSGALSWTNRVNIALDVARALDYLHSVADPPVIHRDVKSSNILLIDDDHAKLADFGLCKLGNDAVSATTPTNVKGSLGYVDTYYLNTGLVSPRSDVYSFGVLLLELITGLKSVQGSMTLAESTEGCRKTQNVEMLIGMLDPELNGNVDIEQLRVLLDVANSALFENSEARPNMTQIVQRISTCMEPQPLPELPV
ncbi:putative leucine-rich repeat receptor-like protein kinase [Nicotiana attenuata]|uniref:non-specific serine/threonine protein kinase n=1 Tax=Nicotiana attenuata TaxID=49451 RepID=A0A1J6KE76_NICAT|nr:putative leucine-rich repeat receptor-like protein kinase [Nicotiana attenuata]